MIIFLLSCTLGRLLPTQLEIGLVQFEQLAPNQVFEQIVHFEQPFYSIPKVALALQKTTYAQALFVKVHNITQENFVIQFYSTSILNATYRYLATIDDRIEIQCINSKIKENIFVKFQKPFTIVPHGLAFFTGFQQENMAKLEIDAIKMLKQGVAIKLNSQNIQTIGLCVVAGPFDAVKTNSKQQPKFGGLVSMKTSAYLSLIAEKALVCEDEECFQAYFQDEGTQFLLKDSPISEEDLVKVLENPEPIKKEIVEQKPRNEPTQEPLQEPLTNLKSFFDQEIMKKQINTIFKKTDEAFEQQIEKENQTNDEISIKNSDSTGKIEKIKQKIEQSISPQQAKIEDQLITQIIVRNKVEMSDDSDNESEQSEDIDWYFQQEDKTSGSIDFQIQLTKLQEAIGNSKKVTLDLPIKLPEDKQWIQIEKQSLKPTDDSSNDQSSDESEDDESEIDDSSDNQKDKQKNQMNQKNQDKNNKNEKNHPHNSIESLKALIQLDQQISEKEKLQLGGQQEIELKQNEEQTKSKEFYDSPFLYDEPVVLVQQKSKIKIDREYADYEIKSAKKVIPNFEEPKATSEKLENYIQSFDKDQVDLAQFKKKQQVQEEKQQNQDPEYDQLRKDEEFLKFKQDYERKTQEKLIEIKGNMRKEKPKFYQDATKVSPQEYRDFFFS